MTFLTSHRAPAWCAMALAWAIALSCAGSQDTGGAGGDTAGGAAREWNRMIIGSWRLTAVDCQGPGSDCRRYEGSRTLRFAKNGELFVDGARRGTYRVEGNLCLLTAGSGSYEVTIVDVDPTRMITGEAFRNTTEIFLKTR